MKPDLPYPTIIDTVEAIPKLYDAIQDSTRLAVDSESNGMHAYREQVCLVQLTTAHGDFVIDPLRLDVSGSLAFVGEALADPAIETILHAAEYDIVCFKRDFGFEINNLFDTMIAAGILGWEYMGLGNMLADVYDVDVNKRHQRADWGMRPLTPDLIRYAQIDTHYLFDLRDKLHTDLERAGRLEEAAELFAEVTMADWNEDEPSPNDFWSLSGARRLSLRQAAVLRELYTFREETARQLDHPVFKIIGDKTLVRIAQHSPTNLRDLKRIQGIGEATARRYGSDLLAAIKVGRKATKPQRPPRPRKPNDELLDRFDRLLSWRKERAQQRGVSSEIIMSKDTLWDVAVKTPQTLDELANIESLGPWRYTTYGTELINLVTE